MDDEQKDTLLIHDGKVRTLSYEGVYLVRPNITLDACFSVPTSTEASNPEERKVAVLVHSWARSGGTLNDSVLVGIKSTLLVRGYHVMSYGARGSGGSKWKTTFSGIQEGTDLQELVRWIRREMSGITTILIVGYSFGALTASLFPILPDPGVEVYHILLSYPLGRRSIMTAFNGGHYESALDTLVQNPRANVLVVYGTKDGTTSESKYSKWSDRLVEQTKGENKGKVEVMKIDGATHEWPERSEQRLKMLALIEEWVP